MFALFAFFFHRSVKLNQNFVFIWWNNTKIVRSVVYVSPSLHSPLKSLVPENSGSCYLVFGLAVPVSPQSIFSSFSLLCSVFFEASWDFFIFTISSNISFLCLPIVSKELKVWSFVSLSHSSWLKLHLFLCPPWQEKQPRHTQLIRGKPVSDAEIGAFA